MAMTIGGSAGITYPNGTVTAAADITTKFTPAITDTANVMTIKNTQFDGTNGVYANGANFNTAVPAFSRVITFTANTSWTVPADNSGQIRIKAWGAGSGGNGGTTFGGAGGFAQCDIAVAQLSTLLVAVGGVQTSVVGGTSGGTNGGGSSLSPSRPSGGGGGYSGVFLNNTATQGNALLVAGGGGGGVNIAPGQGGAGGGLIGEAGGSNASSGGTQSAGGSGGPSGSALQGGNAAGGGQQGGGGGGYWGGGAGVAGVGGGGGGGSSYTNPSATSVTNIAGVGATVANSGDVDYVAGKGIGAASVPGPGYVVIYY